MLTMVDRDIPAVFPTWQDADDAVTELEQLGLADEYLARAVHGGHRMVVEENADRAIFRSVAWGIVFGTPIGVIAGAALVYVSQLVAGDTPTLGVALAAGLGGSLAGIFFGTVYGVARKGYLLYQPDRWAAVPLGGTETLVVPRSHGWNDAVREVLERHGGRVLHDAA